MAYSSILGGERAPLQPSGKNADLLGPSDSSDSGSDAQGEFSEEQLDADSDRQGTGERASAEPMGVASGADIRPDRVVTIDEDGNFTDDDGDPSLSDEALGNTTTDLDEDDAAGTI